MKTYPKIGIVYLSYHSDPYIDDVISTLKKFTYPKEKIEFIIVDNVHPEYGSSERQLHEAFDDLSGKEIPKVTILAQKDNTGFALGNNIGADYAITVGCEYIVYHNEDGFFAADALEYMVETAQKVGVGMVQSLVLLYPESNLVNTDGNCFHYLGFGFSDKYRENVSVIDRNVREIAYASGSALMVSTEVIKKFGGWDKDFFLYHEDLEWSLRLKVNKYKVVIEPRAVFYHKYQFKRSIQKFYWMERNRFGVLLMFYKIPTLLLLLPMLIVMEVGLWVFAVKGGWVDKRVEVWKYWLKKSSWKMWLEKRERTQKMRQIKDIDIINMTSPKIIFQEASMKNPLLLYVGNPIMNVYHTFLKIVIWW